MAAVEKVLTYIKEDEDISHLTKETVTRVGPRRRDPDARPRAVKIVFKDREHKIPFLKNARRLSQHQTFYKLGIQHDKTKLEQEAERKIRDEWKRRKFGEDKEDVVIFEGQVILRKDIPPRNKNRQSTQGHKEPAAAASQAESQQ